MKTKQTTLDRATAVEFLNKFFDAIDVDASNRIDVNTGKEMKLAVKEMQANGSTKEEIADFVDRTDANRERIITAIRKGYIKFDDDFNMTVVLKHPIVSSEASLSVSELKYKRTYKAKDIAKSGSGVNNEEQGDLMIRLLSLRTGISKLVIGELSDQDLNLCITAEGLFSRADLPMKD